jgi:hypothetical protein
MDGRIYSALGLFSAVAVVGLIGWLAAALRKSRIQLANAAPAVLLLFVVLLTLVAYLWYNTKFVQHQGRYLFPALVPLGLGLVLGWQTVACWGGVWAARIGWSDRIAGLLFASPYAGLVVLDIVSLFAFVVPYLS